MADVTDGGNPSFNNGYAGVFFDFPRGNIDKTGIDDNGFGRG